MRSTSRANRRLGTGRLVRKGIFAMDFDDDDGTISVIRLRTRC